MVGGEFVFGMKNDSLPHKDAVWKHLLKISEMEIQLLKLLLMELFNYDKEICQRHVGSLYLLKTCEDCVSSTEDCARWYLCLAAL